jgi:hypothetical protein
VPIPDAGQAGRQRLAVRRSARRRAWLLGGLVTLLLVPTPSAASMPWIHASGTRLFAGQKRFYPYGFNFNYGAHGARTYPNRSLNFFYEPTSARLKAFSLGMARAKRLGANSLRIHLELAAFIKSPNALRSRALDALEKVEDAAERQHLYLDITGNLVWRPWLMPAWYDRLGYRRRWAVQAHFWRAVARVSADSPSVFCYELTSEPIVGHGSGWYSGEFGGYDFVQDLAPDPGSRDPQQLARGWVKQLSHAIRRKDRRHLITVGMLPHVGGATGPLNLGGLLDLLVVHQYPTSDDLANQISVAKAFAAQGKPLLLGEEFAYQLRPTRRFLQQTSAYFHGYLSFFNGRTPYEIQGRTKVDRLQTASLRQFVDLRPYLTHRQPWP